MRYGVVAATIGLLSASQAHGQALSDAVDAVVREADFSGVVGVVRDDEPVRVASYGRPDGAGPTPSAPSRIVRWASVTKMVTSILVMQEVEAGRLALDAPVSRYLPDWPVNAEVTLVQLLRHRSGLANPESLPDADGDAMMDFYQGEGPDWRTACTAQSVGPVGAPFSYNNCDYWLLGAVLQAVTGQDYDTLVRTRIRDPLGLSSLELGTGIRVEAWDGDAPEPRVDPATYGPAGGLYGSVEDLLTLDRAFLDGRLVSAESRAAMFRADPESNFSGLSVWSYPIALAGCGGDTITVVERQGAISGVQVRNLLVPDRGLALVAWTNQVRTDFGQPWAGTGFAVDLLAAAVCGARPDA